MVLLVLITSKCELLDGAFRLAEILADVSIASALSIQFRFQFSDASFHFDHGLPASLQCIDLSFISTGTSILALGFKKLLDGAFRLAEILADVSIASALSIQFR